MSYFFNKARLSIGSNCSDCCSELQRNCQLRTVASSCAILCTEIQLVRGRGEIIGLSKLFCTFLPLTLLVEIFLFKKLLAMFWLMMQRIIYHAEEWSAVVNW
ncbi:hypothetical protein CDAR_369491 [Caerostris darwini]|uniref:Uncharacterized protein n=1 Tax=Caerostris darwini TaxID=1538125 RepID=A0AAV4RXQ6_9ARAC|nr:hypothetical protein CDAR_369491 [Caerostris darwini]